MYCFIFATVFMLLNIRVLLGFQAANPIEKFLFLIAGAILLTRDYNKDVMFFLYIAISITFFSALFSENPNFSWSTYLKSITQILIIFLLCSGKLQLLERELLLKFFAWLPLLMFVLGLIYATVGVRALFSWEYMSGLPRLQLTLIPAFVGGLCIAGCYAALKCADMISYNYFWLLGSNVIILLMTSARMALFVSALLCAYVFFTSFKRQLHLKYLVIVSGFIVLAIILSLVGDIIVGRLTQVHLSGRDIIWAHLEKVASQYNEFGVGFGHQVFFMPREVTILTGGTIGAHNEFLRIKVEIGAIPAILYFATKAIMLLFIVLNKGTLKSGEICVAGILYFMLCFFDNAVAAPSLFLFLVVVVLANAQRPEAKVGLFRYQKRFQ